VNCQNCGAPMELFSRRRYYFCRHCGTFHFLSAPAINGLEVLHRAKEALKCSICNGTLAKALIDHVHEVEFCEQCRGVLMARRTFAEIVARRRAWASGTPVVPLPIDKSELERQVVCPACRNRMEVHPYLGPGNIVMDSCAGCDLVWLDFGELQQIVDAPGRDRGTRDTPPVREPGYGSADEVDAGDDGPEHITRSTLVDLVRYLLS
jgi:Zn-finger nucleic acid-binding protein